MATSNDYSNNRNYSRILGIPLDSGEKPGESLKVTPDTTAWDIYNYHAGRVESEVVKDWNDTLNTLLVFAGLYSAVLTAFITQSIQLLQEDSSSDTRDILLHISLQLATPSTAAFNASRNPFVAPEWALRVNYLFFVSLTGALITALASVLALQWVGSYDRGLNPSSVESRALQRQFRLDGARRWKLEHIIAFLPTIIFISLLLFLVGLAEWLWYIHHNVSIIVIAGASFGALFYAITTLASILSVVAPFRTPASRYLPLWIGLVVNFIPSLFHRRDRQPTEMQNAIASVGFMVIAHHTEATAGQKTPRWKLILRRILRPISPLYSTEPVEIREQKAVSKNNDIKLSSLFWLASSISIEPYHRQTFMIIMQAILEQPEWEHHEDHANCALWKAIFTELHVPYANHKIWVDYSTEDLTNSPFFIRGLSSIGQGFLTDIEFRGLMWSFYGAYSGFGVMCRTMKGWKKLDLESAQKKRTQEEVEELAEANWDSEDNEGAIRRAWEERASRPGRVLIQFQPGEADGKDKQPASLDEYRQIRRDSTFRNLEIALGPGGRFPLEFIVATLQQVKRNHSELGLITIQEMFEALNSHLDLNREAIFNGNAVPFPVLDVVQEIIVSRLSRTAITSLDPTDYTDILKQYLKATEKTPESHEKAISVHEAIMNQAIANLVQINTLRLSSGPRVQEVLLKLNQLAQPPFLKGSQPMKFALLSLGTTDIDIWSPSNRIYTAKSITSLLEIEGSSFNGENWGVWWVDVLLAFGKVIAQDDEDAESIVIKNGQRALSAHLPHQANFTEEQLTRLTSIPHLGVRLMAAAVTQSTLVAKSVVLIDSTQKDKEFWTPNSAWTNFIDFCYGQLVAPASFSDIFMRAFAIGGSSELFDRIYEQSISRRLESPPELLKYLSSPVLPAVLRHSPYHEGRTIEILQTISGQEGFSTEFSKSGGLKWLPTFISARPYYFEEALGIIREALGKCYTFEMSSSWLYTTLACQKEARTAVQKGTTSTISLRSYIAREAGNLIDYLKERTKTVTGTAATPAPVIGTTTGVGTGTGMPIQEEHTPVPDNMQERPVPVGASKGVVETVKKGGPVVPEDESQSKSVNPAVKEWSPAEKRSWEALVNEVIKGFEIYMLPIGDVSELRKFTVEEPEPEYDYLFWLLGDILESPTASLEYFHAPVLGGFLRLDLQSTYTIMATLASISGYGSFASEFVDAEGPQLLPLRLDPVYLEEATNVVYKALSVSTTYGDIRLWLCLMHDCLNAVGIGAQRSYDTRKRVLDYARENLERLASLLNHLDRKWRSDRHLPSTLSPPDEDKPTDEVLKCDASLWSSEEWEDVQNLMDDLLQGALKRGYIIPVPFVDSKCFARDPDGLCVHPRE